MSSSGTYAYNPAFSDVVMAAYARCGIRRTAVTTEQLVDAANEGNLELVRFSNLQPLLWKSELVSLPLTQGTATYVLDKNIVMLLLVTIQTGSGASLQNRTLGPLSTVEYAALPNQTNQAPPTSYWFDRQITPQLTFWPVPDSGGPYTALLRCVTQVQDAAIPSGTTLDLPYRALDAFTAGLAYRLARIHAQQLEAVRKADAAEAWAIFSGNDVESVPFYILPGVGSYYR